MAGTGDGECLQGCPAVALETADGALLGPLHQREAVKGPEHQNLYAEVMALPAKYRLPLYLYYYEGYTAAEVGELLGLGPSTVRTRLARAREKLKAQLREE